MKQLTLAALAVLLMNTVVPAQASDFDAGNFLSSHCSGCHDTSVYTRKQRRVKSLQQLESQIRRCDANLGKQLFDEDIQALTRYLNDNYYHFEK